MISHSLHPAVFLDRDGTLMHDAGYLADPAGVILYEGVAEVLAQLKAAGFRLVVVTNQSGIGRGKFTEADYHAVAARFEALIGPGIIDATYFCPDHADAPSPRRKPAPGMLLEAASDLSLDLARSWMVGDRDGDVQAGIAAGARSILVRTGIGATAGGEGAEFIAKDLAEAASFILRQSHVR
jgi:D-glycero-D-manno-heptose 1,7-bisphosphate phosphatase